jgi:hypothetical protein
LYKVLEESKHASRTTMRRMSVVAKMIAKMMRMKERLQHDLPKKKKGGKAHRKGKKRSRQVVF